MCHTLTICVREQRRQQKRARHLDVLRGQQHLAPVQAIRKDAAEQRKHHDGKLAQKQVQSQVEGFLGQVVDQPALRELLDKRADGGGAGSHPHDAEVTIAKSSENTREEWRGDGH